MRYTLIMMLALAAGAGAQPQGDSSAHESAQNKAWTVPGGASKGVKACHEDIEKFCQGIRPGQSRLGRCLQRNRKSLSKDCRAWLAHGGAGHVDRAFAEIDESTGAAKAPAKTAP